MRRVVLAASLLTACGDADGEALRVGGPAGDGGAGVGAGGDVWVMGGAGGAIATSGGAPGGGGALVGSGGSSAAGGATSSGGGGVGGAEVVDPVLLYEQVFDPETVIELHLTLPPESVAGLDQNPDVYQPGTLQYGDIVLDSVGVRLKGRASFRPITEKSAFKIKFHEFVPDQRLLGLRRLTLNNMVQDPTKVHECLGYWIFRSAGVAASLCNHARVYVNGEYFGLYANVETLDRTFLEARYQPAPGNLYDTTNDTYDVDFDRSLEQGGLFQGPRPPVETLFELETNTSTGDTSDLTALINAISLSSDATFVHEVEAVMDLDKVLDNGAVQAVLADWDGFFGAHNNFKAYHELASDRFILFPWGIDQTFGIMGDGLTKLDYLIDGSNSERDRALLFRRCLADVGCFARYHQAVTDAITVWDALPIAETATAMAARIRSSVEEPSRDETTIVEHDAALADLHRFIAERSAIVWGQL